MRPFAVVCWLFTSCLVAAPSAEEQLLATAPIDRTDAGLLDFLRKRALPKVENDAVKRQIQLLGNEPSDADRAMKQLVALGPLVVQELRNALKDAGAKAKPRVEECLKWIDGPQASELTRAVVRQLLRRRPAGTVEALLMYLPAADEESVADEARQGLTTLAIRQGKIDAELENAALKETDAARRQLAIEIVCQVEARAVIRKLLGDASRDVRLRTATLRLEQADVEAVPVLIDLLGEPASAEARSAHETLLRLGGPLTAGPELASPPRKEAWLAWWKNVGEEGLTKYLRDRTPDIDLDRIGELVAQLGSKVFRVRQKAETDLVNLRGLSIPHLEKAMTSDDIEIRRRADRCLQNIASAPDAPLSAAQVRLVALKRPSDSLKLLMGFVAFADAESVTEEIRQAIRTLVRSSREGITALLPYLADKAPQRRAMAVEVLAEFADAEHLPAMKKLLKDPMPFVQLKAGLGLAAREDRSAVPVLIDVLTQVPPEQGWNVEDALRRLAGEKAPVVGLDDEAARKKSREEWTAWWKEHGDKVDLSLLRRRPTELGLTLLSLWESGANLNYIVEMGRDKKPRWKIEGLGYAFDFVVLPANRILTVEHNNGRVTERNQKGEVLWQYDIASPINCQRLPNGHTFIAASGSCVIVDRQKNVVLKVNTQGGLMGGQRFRDGKIALVNGSGQCFIYDANGTQIRMFQIEGGMSNYGGVQELPNGRFLLAQHHRNKTSEIDQEGKVWWSADSPSPNFATRATNGNTLISSQDNRSVIEVDRQGKQVSKYEPGASVWKVRRR